MVCSELQCVLRRLLRHDSPAIFLFRTVFGLTVVGWAELSACGKGCSEVVLGCVFELRV